MRGSQFNVIRRYNKIKQLDIIEKLENYKTAYLVYEIERQEIVPERFVEILAELCGLDMNNLTNDKWVKKYVSNIPDKFKYRTIFDPLLLRGSRIIKIE